MICVMMPAEGGRRLRPPKHRFVASEDLNITVPERRGLKNRYFGMKLGDILIGLFGTRNCEWKWSIQLVTLLTQSGDDWEFLVDAGAFDEIAQI